MIFVFVKTRLKASRRERCLCSVITSFFFPFSVWKGPRRWVESNSSISSKSGIGKRGANFEPWYLPIGSTVWFLPHVVFLLQFCGRLCDHLSKSTKKPKRKKPSILFLWFWAYITFLQVSHCTQIISVLYVLMQRVEGPQVYEKFVDTPHSWSWRSWFWQTLFLWNADDGFNCLCIPLWKGVPGMFTKVS